MAEIEPNGFIDYLCSPEVAGQRNRAKRIGIGRVVLSGRRSRSRLPLGKGLLMTTLRYASSCASPAYFDDLRSRSSIQVSWPGAAVDREQDRQVRACRVY
jgi:hypothetical protein